MNPAPSFYSFFLESYMDKTIFFSVFQKIIIEYLEGAG